MKAIIFALFVLYARMALTIRSELHLTGFVPHDEGRRDQIKIKLHLAPLIPPITFPPTFVATPHWISLDIANGSSISIHGSPCFVLDESHEFIAFIPASTAMHTASLAISTSQGLYRVLLQGRGIESPYRLVPPFGIKVPKTRYPWMLELYNPHASSLRVLNVSVAPLNAKSIALDLMEDEWELAPRTSRSIALMHLISDSDTTMKTSSSSSSLAYVKVTLSHDVLVLPISFSVVSSGLHVSPTNLNLGTMTHPQQVRQSSVFLLNAESTPISIQDVRLITEQRDLVHLYWRAGMVLPPGMEGEVATLTIVGGREGTGFGGSVLIVTNQTTTNIDDMMPKNNDFLAVSAVLPPTRPSGPIPVPLVAPLPITPPPFLPPSSSSSSSLAVQFQFNCSYGSLFVDSAETFLPHSFGVVESTISLESRFHVPFRIENALCLDPQFQVHMALGTVVSPYGRLPPCKVRFSPLRQALPEVLSAVPLQASMPAMQSMTSHQLVLATSLTTMHIPLTTFHGLLLAGPVFSSQDKPYTSRINQQSIEPYPRYSIRNSLLHVQLGRIALGDSESISINLTNPNPVPLFLTRIQPDAPLHARVKAVYDALSNRILDKVQLPAPIPAFGSSLLELGVSTTTLKGSMWSVVTIGTDRGQELMIRLAYEVVDGALQADSVSFPPAFPGHVVQRDVSIKSTSSSVIKILDAWSSDARFAIHVTNVVLQPGQESVIGHVSFDASLDIGSNYLRNDGGFFAADAKETRTVNSFDVAAARFRDAAWSKVEDKDFTGVVHLLLDTKRIIDVDMSGSLYLPRICDGGDAVIMTALVGETSRVHVTVVNPSSSQHISVTLLQSSLSQQQQVDKQSWWQRTKPAIRLASNAQSALVLAPLESAELGPIIFSPDQAGSFDGMIYIRNNLTHLESIKFVAHAEGRIVDLVDDVDNGVAMTTSGGGLVKISLVVGLLTLLMSLAVMGARELALTPSGSVLQSLRDEDDVLVGSVGVVQAAKPPAPPPPPPPPQPTLPPLPTSDQDTDGYLASLETSSSDLAHVLALARIVATPSVLEQKLESVVKDRKSSSAKKNKKSSGLAGMAVTTPPILSSDPSSSDKEKKAIMMKKADRVVLTAPITTIPVSPALVASPVVALVDPVVPVAPAAPPKALSSPRAPVAPTPPAAQVAPIVAPPPPPTLAPAPQPPAQVTTPTFVHPPEQAPQPPAQVTFVHPPPPAPALAPPSPQATSPTVAHPPPFAPALAPPAAPVASTLPAPPQPTPPAPLSPPQAPPLQPPQPQQSVLPSFVPSTSVWPHASTGGFFNASGIVGIHHVPVSSTQPAQAPAQTPAASDPWTRYAADWFGSSISLQRTASGKNPPPGFDNVLPGTNSILSLSVPAKPPPFEIREEEEFHLSEEFMARQLDFLELTEEPRPKRG